MALSLEQTIYFPRVWKLRGPAFRGGDGGLPCLWWQNECGGRPPVVSCLSGLVPKLEKLGVRSSKRRHRSSLRTSRLPVSGCRLKSHLFNAMSFNQKKKQKKTTKQKKVSFCVSCFRVGNHKLCRFVCFQLEDDLQHCGNVAHCKRNQWLCWGTFSEMEKRDRVRVCHSLYFLPIT